MTSKSLLVTTVSTAGVSFLRGRVSVDFSSFLTAEVSFLTGVETSFLTVLGTSLEISFLTIFRASLEITFGASLVVLSSTIFSSFTGVETSFLTASFLSSKGFFVLRSIFPRVIGASSLT